MLREKRIASDESVGGPDEIKRRGGRPRDMVGMAEKPPLMYEVKRDGDDVLAYVEHELTYEHDEKDEMDDDDFCDAD